MTAVEVGSAYFSLLPSVKGLQGAIAKEVSGVDGKSAGDTIGRGMGTGLSGALKAVVGPALALMAGATIKQFATDAVASFSELEDSTAAAGVVFGSNMNQIIDQSKTAGSTLGLSSQQVINAANTFGTYGKSAGLAGGDLATFSTDLTSLAADMASFKGTSTEQAIEAVGAALRGETEPIRAYGVMLDDASLKNEAMAKGLITTTKDALTPQQKVLAAQSLIFKQTADAQGDFARTSTSTANVAKTLSAETENLTAKVGGFLAPAFTAVRLKALDGVRGISEILDKVSLFQQMLSDGAINSDIAKAMNIDPNSTFGKIFTEGLGSGRAFFGGLREGGEVTSAGVAGAFETAGVRINGIWEDAQGSGRAFFDTLINGGDEITSSGISGFFEGLGIVIHDTFGTLVSTFGPMFSGLFSTLGPVIAALVPQVLTLFTSFSPLGMIFQALLPVLPALTGALGSLGASVGTTLGGILTAIMPVLQQLATVLVDSLGTLFVAMAPVLISLFAQLGSFFQALAPVIIQIVTVVVQLVASLLSALMPVIMQLVAAVMPMVITIFGAVIEAILPLITMILGLLMPVIQALMPIVVTVFSVIADIITNVMQIIMGVIQVVTGIISGNWAQVWSGILSIVSGVFGTIMAVISGAIQIVISVIGNGLNAVFGFFSSIFSGVVNYVTTSFNSIVNGASGMIGDLVGFFGGLMGKITGALGNVGSALFSIGRNIIQGLIDGIGSMMGAIGNAIVSLVPGPIVGVFKDLLGIHSPSRVFFGFGVNTVEGYIGGLDSMKDDLTGSMQALVSLPTVPSFAMQGSRASYDVTQGEYKGYSGPLIEQKVYPSEKMSEQNLADIAAGKIVGALP
ncbi:tail length tape measure protein [Arthrobacter phage Greenhouse]|uniref:Tape measure protein n=1 Tax=Arthrobacter phage Greenhouse TaxID=1897428 RepID=A0A1I9SE43_9CAUD|nr:tail length tape measure protein [Arthrobacter phage Greenhouse]AOZ65120.1 tape measure protein [Arthrobacter phage Greenhouse]